MIPPLARIEWKINIEVMTRGLSASTESINKRDNRFNQKLPSSRTDLINSVFRYRLYNVPTQMTGFDFDFDSRKALPKQQQSRRIKKITTTRQKNTSIPLTEL